MTAVPISSAADLATLRRRTSDGAMPAVLGCGQLRELGRGKQVTHQMRSAVIRPSCNCRSCTRRALTAPFEPCHVLMNSTSSPTGRAVAQLFRTARYNEPLGRHPERIAPVQRAMLAACGQLVTTLMTYASSAGSVATSLARAPA